MVFDITHDSAVTWIADATGAHWTVDDLQYTFVFQIRGIDEPLSISLQITELERLINGLLAKQEREETTLYDAHSYEVLIHEHSKYGPRFFMRKGEVIKKDAINKLSYRLSYPSDEYLLFFLYKMSQFTRPRRAFRLITHRLIRYIEVADHNLSVFDILRHGILSLITLRLESEQSIGIDHFSKHVDSFLFQLSYNLDVALVPQRYIEEIIRSGRIIGSRKSNIDDIEAPKRHFISDLVYHYQMGIASENPALEYLSYYHIAEHFFEAVFKEDMIDQVRNLITLPDFSYNRSTDIDKLIKSITKRLQIQSDTVNFNEQEALKLTMSKYVKLPELVEKVRNYDASLLDYYRTNEVSFANGSQVNLTQGDPATIVNSVAIRVYKTRNAIVHSKDGDKNRYIPFEHDRALIKEVPLMRFVAELIIIGTSEVI